MRRLVLILAALVLAFPISGCGGEDDNTAAETVENGAGTDTGNGETATEGETSTEGETEGGETETEGGSGGGDATAGKAIFASAGCVTCHTLADAGSTGTTGPNLDDAKPDEELVVDRVTNGSGIMPSFEGQLSEQEIQDVAEYVSSTAGS